MHDNSGHGIVHFPPTLGAGSDCREAGTALTVRVCVGHCVVRPIEGTSSSVNDEIKEYIAAYAKAAGAALH